MPVKGIVCKKIGAWKEGLELCDDVDSTVESPLPKVLEGATMRVKVLACGLCFPDVLTMEGKHMMKKTPPYVPCSEISGEVIQVGPGVTKFNVGDRVFGTTNYGGLQTETVVSEDAVYLIPRGVDPDIVAGLEVNYGTTYHGLVDLAKIKAGETLLVLGASGGVGMSAVDLGQALGCKVVACASTDEKLEECRKAGADVLINYVTAGGGDFKKALQEAGVYGNIDVVYDPVGGDFAEPAMRAMGWGGRFVVIGFAAGGANPKSAIPSLPLNLALLNERQIMGCFWGAWKMRTGGGPNVRNVQHMIDLIKDGKLKPVVSKSFPFQGYEEAFDLLMTRKVVGKVVVKPANFNNDAKL